MYCMIHSVALSTLIHVHKNKDRSYYLYGKTPMLVYIILLYYIYTVDSFIFGVTNFRGFMKNDNFVGT